MVAIADRFGVGVVLLLLVLAAVISALVAKAIVMAMNGDCLMGSCYVSGSGVWWQQWHW